LAGKGVIRLTLAEVLSVIVLTLSPPIRLAEMGVLWRNCGYPGYPDSGHIQKEAIKMQTAPIISETMSIPSLKVRVSLSETSTNVEAMAAAADVCAALSQQDSSVEQLRFILGRVLSEIKDKRLFEPEHASFEQFTKVLALKHRLSRSTIQDSLMIARRLPDVRLEQVEDIPITNLTLVARAAKNKQPRQINKLLRDARRPIAEFRENLERQGLIHRKPVNSETGVVIRISVKPAVAKEWNAIVGDRDPGVVLAGLLHAQAKKAA
jgi:hypothetical protein